ncbi:hypothetical protein F4604DRAFT_856083 [Suillus subluteus]|nr:hypothetical protein F4604DRAFT_856083 [Suillus subluteus]
MTRKNEHNSKLNRTTKPRCYHQKLNPPMPRLPANLLLQVLPHHVQDLRIRDSYDCCLISCFFSAAHPLNLPVAMYNQHSCRKVNRKATLHRHKHSTSKVNHKVNNPRLRRHHRMLGLPPPPRPQHLLLLIPVLPQQGGNHAPFHCGPVSFFFSAVHLPRMQIGVNTTASGHLSHL